jgi:hypothetical protein
MRRTLLIGLGLVVVSVGCPALWSPAFAQVPSPARVQADLSRLVTDMGGARLQDFNAVVKGAKEYDGLFKLYQKDDKVYMEILPPQFDKPVLCPIAVARGAGLGGFTLNFDEQWALLFKQVGNKVHLIRRNVHFKAKAGSPLAKAVETSYTDSVLMALPMIAKSPRQGVLINLNDIFMTDFAQLGIGHFDANRSAWHKIKAFARNVELEVQATYGGGRRFFFDDGSTIDPRGNTVIIHYGLAQLPDGGYHPRLADDRVGHFLTAVKDFSSKSKDTSFVRYINRWNLEPAEPLDPKNPHKLSVPKKSIKFYIEKTVPHEYRSAVQEGILEWNKAFEKIGFRNAMEAVQQRDDEDWDPEDMNYNTFRWITTGVGFAMGPSRANPLTGEILDADIIFDADLVRVWKQEQKVFSGTGVALSPISPIKAISLGWGLDHMLLRRQVTDEGGNEIPQKIAADRNEARLRAIRQGVCQCGSHMNAELSMAAMALAERNAAKPGEIVPDDLINQAIKYIVMHEVGHTLGLRHNFKASSMLPNDQLHDTKITRAKGLVGSVMDYVPVNLAPKGTKQGDYYTTTIGPYDYWAIEYAYKPLSGGTDGEVAELQKIANKTASPGHDYGTDEDIFLTADPLINPFDLGADVLRFAKDRVVLAEELLQGLSQRVVDKGEGYQRARLAFEILLSQYGDGAYLVSRYVGGEYANRDHRDDPKGRDPLVPVTTAKQREALKFLQEHIFNDKSFRFPPELLRRLAVERWDHWGTWPGSTDFPLHERILDIQQLALDELLSSSVLRRIQNNALKVDKGEQPLTLAELFRSLTDSIWNDLPTKAPKEDGRTVPSSVICRNLQREHIKRLSTLVLGRKRNENWMVLFYFGDFDSSAPPDARSLSRMHLREISKRIQETLKDKQATVDEATRAHLEECKERIAKVLSASMQVND